jgi:acetyl esterase/lipase
VYQLTITLYLKVLCIFVFVLMKQKINILLILSAVCICFWASSCTKKPTGTGGTNTNAGTSNLTDTIIKNVSYGTDSFQKMDIHLPAKRDGNTRLIVMVHGGAWSAGDKAEFGYYINLIKAEWPTVAIANMNYRLASNKNSIHHPEIMNDIKQAFAHLQNNKGTYVFSDSVAIVGASAGAQLATIYAYNYNDLNNIKCVGDIFGPVIINDWNWYNSFNPWLGKNIKDILTEYVGTTWDSTAYKAVSPYHQAKSTSQPTIIFHGSLDPIVPVYQSQRFKGQLNKMNVKNEYHEYIAFHSFDNTQSSDVIKKMVAFFKTNCN